MVNIVGTEAGGFDFFHGQILGKLIDNGADHFKMGELVGTLRLSLIGRKNTGEEMEGKIGLFTFPPPVPFGLIVFHLFQQFF